MNTHKRSPLYSLYRQIYVVAALSWATATIIPYYAIRSTVPAFRQDPRWSFGQAFILSFLQWVLQFNRTNMDVMAPKPFTEPDQARLNELHSLYKKVPAWYGELKGEIGQWAAKRDVKRVTVPCYWFGTGAEPVPSLDHPAAEGERVFMSFHGGGFINRSAAPDDPTAFSALHLPQDSKTTHRTLSVEYRLSSLDPDSGVSVNPFPTALLDALAAYHYLLSLGFEPRNIYPIGDSAGGNLVLTMCHYLLYEENTKLGGLILLSPWCDMSASHTKPGLTRTTNFNTDIIGVGCEPGSYSHTAYLGSADAPMPDNLVYISPACLDINPPPPFTNWPRTFIAMGEDEQFLDEGRTLHTRLSESVSDKGSIVLDITPVVSHDFTSSRIYDPIRAELAGRIADWVDSV